MDGNRVIVLHAELKGHRAARALQGLLEKVPYAKRLELERRSTDGCAASLCGLSLAVEGIGVLTGKRPAVGEFRFPQGGKPFLPGGPSFSISHCDSRVACAVASAGQIGIDLEDLPSSRGVVQDRHRLQRWTAVEATLKAAGAGLRALSDVKLDEELSLARFDGRDYLLTPTQLDPEVIACVAATVEVAQWTIEQTCTATGLMSAVPGKPAP
jgi:4'-phosphopantetheinyl transferase